MKQKIIKTIPILIFIVLLTSTLITWKVTQDFTKREARENFQQDFQITKHWVQDRLGLYLPTLLGIRVFSEWSDEVTAGEWSYYIQRLELLTKYPAISSIIYIERVKDKNGDSYVVKYTEPSEGNGELIGLDLGLDPERLSLLNDTRDEDPTSTGTVTLIPYPGEGFEVILPVYGGGSVPETINQRRATLKGFIQAKFEGDKLFKDIFDTVEPFGLNFEVYSSSSNKENLLYDQDPESVITDIEADDLKLIVIDEAFEFNGQMWHLVASTESGFGLSPSQVRLPWIVLGAGVVISFTLLRIGLYVCGKRSQFFG
ncbi:CHASE domain-containing protein [Patescibacteria group bacterium]